MGFIGFMFIFILICSWVISLNGTNPYGFHIDCLGWKVNILMKSMSMGDWNGSQTCWFPSLSAILSLKNTPEIIRTFALHVFNKSSHVTSIIAKMISMNYNFSSEKLHLGINQLFYLQDKNKCTVCLSVRFHWCVGVIFKIVTFSHKPSRLPL